MDIDIATLSDSFVQLLKDNPALTFTENGRVKCTLTNHEMPCREKAVAQHVNAKRYKKLSKGVDSPYSLDNYQPFLELCTEKGKTNQLICNLTMRYVNNQPDHVIRHVNGKKFQRAKKRYLECEKTGKTFVPAPLMVRASDIAEFEAGGEEAMFDSDGEMIEVDEINGEEAGSDNEEELMEEEEKEPTPKKESKKPKKKAAKKQQKKTATVTSSEVTTASSEHGRSKRKGTQKSKATPAKKTKKDNLIIFE